MYNILAGTELTSIPCSKGCLAIHPPTVQNEDIKQFSKLPNFSQHRLHHYPPRQILSPIPAKVTNDSYAAKSEGQFSGLSLRDLPAASDPTYYFLLPETLPSLGFLDLELSCHGCSSFLDLGFSDAISPPMLAEATILRCPPPCSHSNLPLPSPSSPSVNGNSSFPGQTPGLFSLPSTSKSQIQNPATPGTPTAATMVQATKVPC